MTFSPSPWTRSTTVSPFDAVIFRQSLVLTPLLLASSAGARHEPVEEVFHDLSKPWQARKSQQSRLATGA